MGGALKRRLSGMWFSLLLAAFGGALYALALPPVGLSFLGFICLIPLLVACSGKSFFKRLLLGFVWGFCWTLPAYYFLREIEPAVPYLIAITAAFWYAVFAAVDRMSEIRGVNRVLRAFFTASLFVIIEWSKSRMFPWDELATTQWNVLPLVQIAALGGGYMVSFLVAAVNTLIFAALSDRKHFLAPLDVAFLLVAASAAYGWYALTHEPTGGDRELRALLIQGDLSQRRHPAPGATEEALDVYYELSRAAMKQERGNFDVVFSPESSLPVPFGSAVSMDRLPRNSFAYEYQRTVRGMGVPLLIGALDFERTNYISAATRITNSALLVDGGDIVARYDKCHRVPYGEYIPLRFLLPQFLINQIDMGRDLVPGTSVAPIRLPGGCKAGMMICFESVFGCLARERAAAGANALVVLSNDAWYPTSSEPEQHLANAVMRSIETRLPMVRCGNNGGSLVVTPYGRITQVIEVPGPEARPELRRGRGFGVVKVVLRSYPEPTLYVRWGEWFIYLLIAFSVVMTIGTSFIWFSRRGRLA
ncbi:MAG: apolipoprotein N-acyltransferase [Victivallaceae bacterium]|nr:apolipoprotein N-acyltransferase [Victivallaceae bacterium]